MNPASPVEALHGELRDASPTLVGNADLLRSVLSGCGDCIKVLDLEGRLIFMSEGGKRVMEVDDFSLLKGCPWPGFWAGEGNACALAAVADARDGKTARFRGAANTAKGNPRYWDVQVSPIHGDDGKPSHLLSISRDITEEWNATELLKKNAERQDFLTAELQHRVKNMLATVMAIANRTFRDKAHEAPRQTFGARLMALSHAHNMLTELNWDRAGIFGIIRGALETHQLDLGPGCPGWPGCQFGYQASAGPRAGGQRACHQRLEIRLAVEARRDGGRVVVAAGDGREALPSCGCGARRVVPPSSRRAERGSAPASSRRRWRTILAGRSSLATNRTVSYVCTLTAPLGKLPPPRFLTL